MWFLNTVSILQGAAAEKLPKRAEKKRGKSQKERLKICWTLQSHKGLCLALSLLLCFAVVQSFLKSKTRGTLGSLQRCHIGPNGSCLFSLLTYNPLRLCDSLPLKVWLLQSYKESNLIKLVILNLNPSHGSSPTQSIDWTTMMLYDLIWVLVSLVFWSKTSKLEIIKNDPL